MITAELQTQVETILAECGLAGVGCPLRASDRPDLSDLQSNVAMMGAKQLKKKPLDIANELKAKLESIPAFASISVDGPGFLNFRLTDAYILNALQTKAAPKAPVREKIIIDYGGPNVAKPLHVGHLRAAIIGEALKRMGRALGHDVIGDIHMGDWGTPMGMLIAELAERHPEWPYFQDPFTPSAATANPPFAVDALNELYPQAAAKYKDKENTAFADKAREATAKLQAGHAGYRALWKHFVTLSIGSIKADYGQLDVDFDLWLGESDADPYIPAVVTTCTDKGIAERSDGALIVRVTRESDGKRELAPLILQKSDGAATYATTDLATIYARVQDYNPDRILYVVDKRQSEHFEQVFRTADKAGMIAESKLEHIGFGTMNGADGKPFKTRAGGVMRLSDLIGMAKDTAAAEAGYDPAHLTAETSAMLDAIAVAAIKFGDLINPCISDYVFSPETMVRMEGKTGPYIQYALVRAKAVLAKAGDTATTTALPATFGTAQERDLALQLINFAAALLKGFEARLPSDLCVYAYDLARVFNTFYKACPIATESDPAARALRIALTRHTVETLANVLSILAIPAPERMTRAETEKEAA